MKRVLLFLVLILLIPTIAFAFGLSDVTGWIKGIAGSDIAKIIALGLSAILGLGFMARFTPVITIVSIFCQALFVSLAVLCEAIGAVFGFVGAVFEDMKVSSEEVSQAPEVWKQFLNSAKESFRTIGIAWNSMKTQIKAQSDA